MKRLGLIGYPLSHSLSPRLFNDIFKAEGLSNWSYSLFPREDLGDIRQWLTENPDICGLNVTIPHKQAVIPFLDDLHDSAEQTGAVNCIKVEAGPPLRLTGFNTDTTGFTAMLDAVKLPSSTQALVLGNGGAARAVQYVLRLRNIPFHTVGRNLQQADFTYENLPVENVTGAALIVQTTPLGTLGELDTLSPGIPYSAINAKHICLDLVYNPPETHFMKRCAQQGALVMNGMRMLETQARAAWEIFRR
jgi:shikimate dehydrogenase